MNDAEFERLYADEAQGLFAFLSYRTGDRALAEDLLADAFERALRAKYNRRKGPAKTWLYAIALNALRDHVRRSAAESRAYARVDAAAYYKLIGGIEAQINVENIFGADYFPTAHSDNNIAPGGPRTVKAMVRFGF